MKRTYPRDCKGCRKPFDARTPSGVWCTDECKAEWMRTKSDRRRPYLALLERDGFKCIYCGRTSIVDGVKLMLDHIRPHTDGGDDTASNLVTACAECNLKKGRRFLKPETATLIENVVRGRNLRDGISPSAPVASMKRA